jgi:hypothetical protein
MTLLQTTPKKQDLPKIRQQRSLVRGVNLRTNANVISPSSFQARKAYMVQAYQEGKFLADPESRGKPRPNPMSDPAAMEGMMGMMKGNMAMMIPQSLIMGWINAFFSGFVISKSTMFLYFALGPPLGQTPASVIHSSRVMWARSGHAPCFAYAQQWLRATAATGRWYTLVAVAPSSNRMIIMSTMHQLAGRPLRFICFFWVLYPTGAPSQ